MGKRLLRKQNKLLMSFKDIQNHSHKEDVDSSMTSSPMSSSRSFLSLLHNPELPHTSAQKQKHYDSACAAAGQFEMMNLYQSLFSNCEVTASQLLVTQADFSDPDRLQNLRYATERLLSLGIIPIVNENDAGTLHTHTPVARVSVVPVTVSQIQCDTLQSVPI
jgi:delta-1-pyrroline-5-carboxylate synthetase